jgi:hypothetical protein
MGFGEIGRNFPVVNKPSEVRQCSGKGGDKTDFRLKYRLIRKDEFHGTQPQSDLEEQLTALASAKGLSVDAFIQQVVNEKSAVASPRRLSPDEWAR